jgi:hypothetical protein
MRRVIAAARLTCLRFSQKHGDGRIRQLPLPVVVVAAVAAERQPGDVEHLLVKRAHGDAGPGAVGAGHLTVRTAAAVPARAGRPEVGELVGQPHTQRAVEAEEEHALAGGAAASRRLDGQQRLARTRRSVEDHPRVTLHGVQRFELLPGEAAQLFVDPAGARLRALVELELGAQEGNDLGALRRRRLAVLRAEAAALGETAAPALERMHHVVAQRPGGERPAVYDLPLVPLVGALGEVDEREHDRRPERHAPQQGPCLHHAVAHAVHAARGLLEGSA